MLKLLSIYRLRTAGQVSTRIPAKDTLPGQLQLGNNDEMLQSPVASGRWQQNGANMGRQGFAARKFNPRRVSLFHFSFVKS
jgi:hypothetical protein